MEGLTKMLKNRQENHTKYGKEIHFTHHCILNVSIKKKMDCVTETITKMIESLPKSMQERVLEEIKPIISEALDEAEWQIQFEGSQEKLVSVARKAKREIKTGKAEPMDYEKL